MGSLVTLAGNDLDATVVDPQIAIYHNGEGGVQRGDSHRQHTGIGEDEWSHIERVRRYRYQ